MSLHNKNSYGATDLEAGTSSHIKDAADGPRRFAVIAAVGVFGLLGFVSASTSTSRSGAMTSLYGYGYGGWGGGNWQDIVADVQSRDWGAQGRIMGEHGREIGQAAREQGQAEGEKWRNYGQNIANNYGGHGIVIGGDDKCNNVIIGSSINGKYVKFAHTGPHGLEDNTNWKSTNGQTCESIYTSKNKKSHCKQANKHGVTGNDACQCSC